MTRYIARFSVGKCLSIEMHRNNEKMKKMKKMKNEKKGCPSLLSAIAGVTVHCYLADEMKAKLNAPLDCSHSRSKSKCTKGKCMSSALKHQRIRSARSD